MNIKKPQNEVGLITKQMHDICKPLHKLGISCFSFVRYYQDGSRIQLSNRPTLFERYDKRGPYNGMLNEVPDFEGTLLWSNINKHPLFYEIAEFRELDNGTLIVLKLEDITERYFFGSIKTSNDANYTDMYHLDLLKRFILYFKEAAKCIIEQTEKSRVWMPPREIIQTEENRIARNLRDEFILQTKFTSICIRANKQDVYVNQNEAKILTLMKNGYTAKEISLAIGLTRKTVEIYRDKLKTKLDLFSRSGLLSIAHANTLLSFKLLKNS